MPVNYSSTISGGFMAKQKAQNRRGNFNQRLNRIAKLVVNIPRTTRIVLAMAISLVFVAAVWLPLSAIFESMTWVIPAVLWLVAYGLGWWGLIGFDDAADDWEPGRPTAWILILGGVSLLLLIIEIIFALLFGFVF
jgi:hypothetical protein